MLPKHAAHHSSSRPTPPRTHQFQTNSRPFPSLANPAGHPPCSLAEQACLRFSSTNRRFHSYRFSQNPAASLLLTLFTATHDLSLLSHPSSSISWTSIPGTLPPWLSEHSCWLRELLVVSWTPTRHGWWQTQHGGCDPIDMDSAQLLGCLRCTADCDVFK